MVEARYVTPAVDDGELRLGAALRRLIDVS
jgi:hypothetical protein